MWKGLWSVSVFESFFVTRLTKGALAVSRACGLCLQQCSVSLAYLFILTSDDSGVLAMLSWLQSLELSLIDKAKQEFKLFKSIMCLGFHLGCLPR